MPSNMPADKEPCPAMQKANCRNRPRRRNGREHEAELTGTLGYIKNPPPKGAGNLNFPLFCNDNRIAQFGRYLRKIIDAKLVGSKIPICIVLEIIAIMRSNCG